LNVAVKIYYKIQSQYSPNKSEEKPRETWGRIACNPNYIWNGHLTNTSL